MKKVYCSESPCLFIIHPMNPLPTLLLSNVLLLCEYRLLSKRLTVLNDTLDNGLEDEARD